MNAGTGAAGPAPPDPESPRPVSNAATACFRSWPTGPSTQMATCAAHRRVKAARGRRVAQSRGLARVRPPAAVAAAAGEGSDTRTRQTLGFVTWRLEVRGGDHSASGSGCLLAGIVPTGPSWGLRQGGGTLWGPLQGPSSHCFRTPCSPSHLSIITSSPQRQPGGCREFRRRIQHNRFESTAPAFIG